MTQENLNKLHNCVEDTHKVPSIIFGFYSTSTSTYSSTGLSSRYHLPFNCPTIQILAHGPEILHATDYIFPFLVLSSSSSQASCGVSFIPILRNATAYLRTLSCLALIPTVVIWVVARLAQHSITRPRHHRRLTVRYWLRLHSWACRYRWRSRHDGRRWWGG